MIGKSADASFKVLAALLPAYAASAPSSQGFKVTQHTASAIKGVPVACNLDPTKRRKTMGKQ